MRMAKFTNIRAINNLIEKNAVDAVQNLGQNNSLSLFLSFPLPDSSNPHNLDNSQQYDKYGERVLGELFLETGENVAEILIHGGWARPYHCEKKKPWTLEELSASPFV